jgi:chromosome condensin MukBEF MukE localization factor|tara:strand:- start:183 stop:422 length:240 start_codon:yes stop_codon:yes gene_type:complete
MPVKYKPTSNVVKRGSTKRIIEHHYMKAQSIKELLECYNNVSTKPKLRQKVKNELIRRKRLGLVNIITRDESGNVSEFK